LDFLPGTVRISVSQHCSNHFSPTKFASTFVTEFVKAQQLAWILLLDAFLTTLGGDVFAGE
jgi:hypothetical protein